MSTLAISAANLDILERSLLDLASNVGGVNKHVEEVSTHLYDVESNVQTVTDNVKSLEEEIKAFMLEIRGSTVVSNAKQSIMMDQAELDKKFGHYDEVRRRISGILQSADIKAVQKSTVLNISENTIINAPNYWLAPALVALCAWYLNDKALADRALNEAIKRDDEKTSLLFSLIHLRAGRVDTAILWLDRYLSMQDPSKMEAKIITVIDAISNGNYGNRAVEIFMNKINDWVLELNALNDIKNTQIERWKNYFDTYKPDVPVSCFPYLVKFGDNVDLMRNISAISLAKNLILDDFNKIISLPVNNNDNNIDALVNNLVFNYENEELELKADIVKNKLIIEENGNINLALEKFKENKYALDRYNDFYTHLTNCALGNKNINYSVNTRKFSIAFCKEIIHNGYQKFCELDNFNKLPDITISIEDWKGVTKIGDNEKELCNSLKNHFENKHHNEVYEDKYFNIKMLISIIILIVSSIFVYKVPLLLFFIILCVVLFNAFEVYKAYKSRKSKKELLNNLIKQNTNILINSLAEVVDYYKVYKENLKCDQDFLGMIDNLNYNNYIKTK